MKGWAEPRSYTVLSGILYTAIEDLLEAAKTVP